MGVRVCVQLCQFVCLMRCAWIINVAAKVMFVFVYLFEKGKIGFSRTWLEMFASTMPTVDTLLGPFRFCFLQQKYRTLSP